MYLHNFRYIIIEQKLLSSQDMLSLCEVQVIPGKTDLFYSFSFFKGVRSGVLVRKKREYFVLKYYNSNHLKWQITQQEVQGY